MEYIDNKINYLISGFNEFSRKDFENKLNHSNLGISITSLSRIFERLVENNLIVRTRRGKYKTIKENIRTNFDYELDGFSARIIKEIEEKYPLIEYEIWNSGVLNKFANHLLSHNFIFIEVESDLVDTIFEMLMEKGYHVLLDPDEEMFFRYFKDNVIVVRKLLSQSPKNTIDKNKIVLERLLVDLISDKLLKNIISKAEIPYIYQECLQQYNINTKKMERYATRRGTKNLLTELINGNKAYD